MPPVVGTPQKTALEVEPLIVRERAVVVVADAGFGGCLQEVARPFWDGSGDAAQGVVGLIGEIDATLDCSAVEDVAYAMAPELVVAIDRARLFVEPLVQSVDSSIAGVVWLALGCVGAVESAALARESTVEWLAVTGPTVPAAGVALVIRRLLSTVCCLEMPVGRSAADAAADSRQSGVGLRS